MEAKYNWNAIVFFDGECALCNRAAYFLHKIDRKRKLKFTSLQSGFAGKILTREHKRPNEEDTILFLSNGRISIKSEALLQIISVIGFPYSLFAVLKIIPRNWRNKMYDYIAGNRHAWFGRTDNCKMMELKFRERFLS